MCVFVCVRVRYAQRIDIDLKGHTITHTTTSYECMRRLGITHRSHVHAQVIKGWTEAMQLMVEGDLWEMYIPSELGYGDRGSPPKIPGGSVLVFKMEILEIKGEKTPRCDITTFKHCSDRAKSFIEKQRGKQAENEKHYNTELERLHGLSSGKMKPELDAWRKQRIALLHRMKDEL